MQQAPRVNAVDEAAEIADEILFPAAMWVDGAQRVPREHLDLLAERGFYGLCGATEHGGLGLTIDEACRVIENLASGCLATTFVWRQHHSTVVLLRYGPNAGLRERFLAPMCSGQTRSGIAVNSPRRANDMLRARKSGSGYLLDGRVDWVTGWGLIDVLRVAARDDDGKVLQFLVDPVESDNVCADPMNLIAANASSTVRLTFVGQHVPGDRFLSAAPPESPHAVDVRINRFSAALALGVAQRGVALAEVPELADELQRRRFAVETADEKTMPAARAAALDLAVRAAAAAFVTGGSSSVLDGAHAGRLMREAQLLTVFAVPPGTRASLVRQLSLPEAVQ